MRTPLLLAALGLVGLVGCLQMPDEPSLPPQPGFPGGTLPADSCGDNVCDPVEYYTCPADCASEYPQPTPPAPPPPACHAGSLDSQLPVDLHDTTVGGLEEPDTAGCGDGTSAPMMRYDWTAPASGLYTIGATGDFALVLEVSRQSCNGDELSCAGATDPATPFGLYAGQTVAITITGLAGASGAFELTIARQPDACGDGVCESSEVCDVCASDCGTCPPPPTCGDGRCDAGETCAIDCDTSSGPTSTCGDGVCDSGESCSIDCDPSTGGGTTTGGDDSGGGSTWGDDSGSGDDGSTWGDDDGSGDDGSTWGDDDGSDSGDDGSDSGDDDDWSCDDDGFCFFALPHTGAKHQAPAAAVKTK